MGYGDWSWVTGCACFHVVLGAKYAGQLSVISQHGTAHLVCRRPSMPDDDALVAASAALAWVRSHLGAAVCVCTVLLFGLGLNDTYPCSPARPPPLPSRCSPAPPPSSTTWACPRATSPTCCWTRRGTPRSRCCWRVWRGWRGPAAAWSWRVRGGLTGWQRVRACGGTLVSV